MAGSPPVLIPPQPDIRGPTSAAGGVCNVGAAEPRWDFVAEDAAELARLRRGVEPLRIAVPPRRAADPATLGLTGVASATMAVEPMPIAY